MAEDSTARKQLVAALFGRAAATYSQVGPDFFGHFGERLVLHAHLAPGDMVLDIAGGRGAVLFPATGQVGKGGHVLSIDLAEPMVAATRDDILQRGIHYAEAHQMDAEQLELPDASFDAVLCGFGIMFLPELARGLREMHRVLRPGGTIGVTTWGEPDRRWTWTRELVKTYSEGAELTTQVQRLDKPSEITMALEAAGFVALHSVTESFEAVYHDEETWWASIWSHGQRAGLEAMTPSSLAGFKAEAVEKMQSQREPRGFPQIWQAHITVGHRPDTVTNAAP